MIKLNYPAGEYALLLTPKEVRPRSLRMYGDVMGLLSKRRKSCHLLLAAAWPVAAIMLYLRVYNKDIPLIFKGISKVK